MFVSHDAEQSYIVEQHTSTARGWLQNNGFVSDTFRWSRAQYQTSRQAVKYHRSLGMLFRIARRFRDAEHG
jgi:hypothetical protein